MNLYEAFRQSILRQLAKPSAPRETHYQVWQLGNWYGIDDRQVCEILIEMCQQRLISISGYDGQRSRLWNEWPNADALFYNCTDRGHVRASILAAGAELAASFAATPIGFVVN